MQRQPDFRTEPAWGGDGRCWHLLKQCLRSSPELRWQLLHHSSRPDTHRESIYTHLPFVAAPQQTVEHGWQRLGSVIGCEGQRGLAPEATSEQSKGNNYWRLHRQHIGDSLNRSQEPTWTPFASALAHCGARVPVLVKGKAHT